MLLRIVVLLYFRVSAFPTSLLSIQYIIRLVYYHRRDLQLARFVNLIFMFYVFKNAGATERRCCHLTLVHEAAWKYSSLFIFQYNFFVSLGLTIDSIDCRSTLSCETKRFARFHSYVPGKLY
jgi:hypothetical protein